MTNEASCTLFYCFYLERAKKKDVEEVILIPEAVCRYREWVRKPLIRFFTDR